MLMLSILDSLPGAIGVLGQTFISGGGRSLVPARQSRARRLRCPISIQGTLLILLLSFLLILFHVPSIALFGIHPWILLLFAGYGYGLRLVAQASDKPMWRFVSTPETRPDTPANNSFQKLSFPQPTPAKV